MQEKTIGVKIREYRQKKGLTQDALAAELHVSSQAVSKWENGQTMPDISLLMPISRVLGIGVNDLLGGDRRAEYEREWQRALPFGDELALLAAEDALKDYPDDEEFLFRRAQTEYDLGVSSGKTNVQSLSYLGQAQEHFEYLHTNFPDNDQYTVCLSEVYFARGKREKALDLAYSVKNASRQKSLIAKFLGGEEEIRYKQTKLESQMKNLYNTLVDLNTRESINVAHALLDVMMGEGKALRSNLLWSLYLSDAVLCLDEGDLEGYVDKFTKAYEAVKAYNALSNQPISYTDPLFDRLKNERMRGLDRERFLWRFLSDEKLGHPASLDLRRRIADECVDCYRLLKHEWIEFYQFCRYYQCRGGGANFATKYNKESDGLKELAELFKKHGSNLVRECHYEHGKNEVERLVGGGKMNGFAARIGNRIVGYCNAWDKKTYTYLPMPEKYHSAEEGERVMFFAEIIVADNFKYCGIEERLISVALDWAENNDYTKYTKAEVYICDNNSAEFDRAVALYEKFGFSIAHDLTEDGRRRYIMQKELGASDNAFKQFERKVMELIAREKPEFSGKIMAQYNKCRVTGREFTGHGFYTDFEVTDPADSLGEGYCNELGNLHVEFPGVSVGAGFVLFVRNGFIELLEGFIYGDEPWPERITEFRVVGKMDAAIKEVINQNDPKGLLSIGCPEDEYKPEIDRLSLILSEDMSEEEISAAIRDVFVDMFSEPIDKSLCDKMAREILGKI